MAAHITRPAVTRGSKKRPAASSLIRGFSQPPHKVEKIIETAHLYWESAFRRVRVVLGAGQLQVLRSELSAR
jgi:hypothetical protein